jgi:superfamily II DNA/RNA helicase
MQRKNEDLRSNKTNGNKSPLDNTPSSMERPAGSGPQSALSAMNKRDESFATDKSWEDDIPSSSQDVNDESTSSKEGGMDVNSVPAPSPIRTSTHFDCMGLKENILRGIFSAGYETPSPCQQTIPAALPDPDTGIVRDVILAAKAGSGKTLYFASVALNAVDTSISKTQVVIVSPTRELAFQTFNEVCRIAAFSGVSVAFHRGVGNKNKKDNNTFASDVSVKSESYITYGNAKEGFEHIVVATPGRLLDIMTNDRGVRVSPTKFIKKVDMRFVRLFIMDEADELLSPKNEFQDTVANIFSNIPTIEFCQKIIVSATMTPCVLEICSQILKNPVQILIKKEDNNILTISQYYVGLLEEADKMACLEDIYKKGSIGTSIIFTNRAEKGNHIYEMMRDNGFSVGFIHAGLPITIRDGIMKDFREGRLRVLIATDLLARGIDVQSVSTVFNYDLPTSMENYIHRIGRCGRYGRVGVSVNLVVEPYNSKPKDIVALENHFNIEIKPLPNLEVFH